MALKISWHDLALRKYFKIAFITQQKSFPLSPTRLNEINIGKPHFI
jgi:hypothetical protein